jgi:SprT protein
MKTAKPAAKKASPRRRAYLKKLALNLGSAMMTLSDPRKSEKKGMKHMQRRRDRGLEEVCKGLVNSIDSKNEKWSHRIRVYWNPRLRTSFGLAYYQDLAIHLNPRLYHISTATMWRCLRHELAHLLAWRNRKTRNLSSDHGWEWKHACAQLGIPNEPAYGYIEPQYQHLFESVTPHRKYHYQCPKCRRLYKRVHPINPKKPRSCKKCCERHNGGVFSAKYRLRLKKVDSKK